MEFRTLWQVIDISSYSFSFSAFFSYSPSYYQNTWNAVSDEDFHGWRIAFDRSVIARLVQSRQAGRRAADQFEDLVGEIFLHGASDV
jgi:hypothetical protein